MKAYEAKHIIASLDFDGVLAHGLQVKRKYAKKWFNANLELHQTKKKGFNKLMKTRGHPVINYQSLMDPLNEQHIMEYKVPQHCKTILHDLYKQGFRYTIITSRNEHDYPYAKQFINYHFKTFIKHTHNTRDEPKTEFVRKIRPRLHLDDDINKLEQLKEEPVHLAYYRQPENHHKELDHQQKEYIQEIRNWHEFKQYAIELKELHEAICWKHDIKNDFKHTREIIKHARRLNNKYATKLVNEYKAQKT